MVLEYLSGNELLAFPFKDKCSLKSTGNVQLVDTVFADALIVAKRPDVVGAYLNSITCSGGNVNVKITAVSDPTFTSVSDVICSIPYGDIEKHKMVFASSADFSVKLILGSGFLDLVDTPDLIYLPANATFVEACVVPYVPRVNSIAFYNATTLVGTITASQTDDRFLILEQGSNVNLTYEPTKLVMQVYPGYGTGLYDGCSTDLVIETIDDIGPDIYQNFLLLTDGCYETEKGYQGEFAFIPDFGITLTNTCAPKCTSSQMSAFAHYLNRVRDGMHTVSTYVTSVEEELNAAITAFEADLTRVSPIIKAAVTKFDNVYGNPYYSFVVSFFNKSDNEELVSVTITGAPAPQSDSVRFKQGSRTTSYNTLNIEETVPCHEQGRFEFVIQSTPGSTITIAATAGISTFNKVYTLT